MGLRQGKTLPIEGQHIVSAAGRSYTEQRVGVMVDADSKPLAPAFNKSVVGTAQGGVNYHDGRLRHDGRSDRLAVTIYKCASFTWNPAGTFMVVRSRSAI